MRWFLVRFSYFSILSVFLFLGLILSYPVQAEGVAQAPTVDIPTVTSTPLGVQITVRLDTDQTQINVRSGPGTFYEKVGVLLAGQKAPAKGRSVGGEWILIEYPGIAGGQAWVYAPLVDIPPGANLPIVAPPPTPSPVVTTTIDPTLAAQFVVTVEATRLPTFTAPPPLVFPTFEPITETPTRGGVPMGLIIISLASAGLILGLFSLAQGR